MRLTLRICTALSLAPVIAASAAIPAAAGDGSPPAPADDPAAVALAVIEDHTSHIEEVVRRTEKRTSADWEPVVAEAVAAGSLNRLERALARIRVETTTALEPVIGPHSTGEVPAAITALMFHEDMDYRDRYALDDALATWRRFERSVDRALTLRDGLRERLGLPAVTGLRVCPLETVDTLLHDWGDPRGWWRVHRGNDINAPEGTRLVAMERGEVIQMGWHWLGGNGIYVLGDVTGDVYYYAHMSDYAEGIDVGSPVMAGQVVGYVGDTGNADLPHLHLGWMPAAGRVDLDGLADAYPMLVELCL